jgi:micrococcal nuclease
MKYSFKNVICTRVLDGDTIEVVIDFGFYIQSKQRLRLVRINAPETRTKNQEEKDQGLASKGWLKYKIEGKSVIIHTTKAGKYGRWLAEVFYNQININDELVKKGFATYYG